MRLTIATRLTIVFALLAIVLVGALLLLSYSTAILALEDNAKTQMELGTEDKATEVEAFLRGQQAEVQSLAGTAALMQAMQAAGNGPAKSTAESRAALQLLLTVDAAHAGPNAGIFMALGEGGEVLASTDPAQATGNYRSEPFFQRGLSKPYVHIPSGPEDPQRAIFIATPVRAQDGKSLGVLAERLDLSALQAVVGKALMGGQTGDQYLLNGQRYFITQPRLRAGATILSEQDTGQAAPLCNAGSGTNALTAVDYRGVRTVTAYRWLADYSICVISKVDLAEVTAPAGSLRNTLLGAGFIALAGALLAAVLLARTVTRPLAALQRGVEAFGHGDYSHRIAVRSKDEVGDLAVAFNSMAQAIARQEELLVETNRALEDKVIKRTEALHASQAELLVLFSAMQDLVLIYDRDGKYVHSVPTGNKRLGLLLHRMEGQSLEELLPAETAREALRHIRRVLAGRVGTDFEYELRAGRRRFHFIASISALTDERVIWVARDVTARHATQQALTRSEALNRAVTENSPIGISIRNRHSRLIYANRAWCKMRGYADLEEAIARSRAGKRSPLGGLDYLGEQAAAVAQIYETGGSIFLPEVEIVGAAPGAASWLSQYFYAIQGKGGQVESVVTLTQDITSRKESEQEVEAILDFSAAVRRPISRLETETAILDKAETIFSTAALGLVVRKPGSPSVMTGAGRGAWKNWQLIQASIEGGLMRQILNSGGLTVIDDIEAGSHIPPTHLAGMKSLAAVPLATRAEVIGALVLGDHHPPPESKLQLLRAIGEIAASALYRATLIEETERRLEWLMAIRSIDQAIMGSLDVRITVNMLLEKAVTQLQMDAASILLLRGSQLEYAYGRGFKAPQITKTSLSLGKPQAGKAALENRPIFVGAYDPQAWDSEVMNVEGFRSYCAVPLVSQGQVQGVLEVYAYRTMEQDNEWMEFLLALAGLAALSLDTARLFDAVQRTNVELSMAYDITLEGWSRSIDMRYDKSPGHTQRVVDLTIQLAQALKISGEDLVHIRRGAFLHDIGTIMVPEEILLKPTRLSEPEASILHQYPAFSFEMLRTIEFLRPALDIPYCHHEKWDGSGFPRGLKTTEIPFAARIFAVVETWDSLTHDRPFRKAWSRRKALTYISQKTGQHFDPEVVRAFLRILDPAGELTPVAADEAGA